ncbi:hypothetical protein OG439_25640 [Amycolatopsis sp. NBC_01307]|uniref:hypothetical protein n=1 Tax=Amycolatopsis sp. NBC_01307 TaxID=2903561 RepID=UPI002E11EBC3|nr:hypothetical protein OG439_25640 [Amycolatopsis sp. NBC_01307]
MTVSTSPAAAHDRMTPRARGLLLVLCGAMFLDALDVSMKASRCRRSAPSSV